MKTMWEEINLRFRELSLNNILLIDDCPYKFIGNPPFFNILPHPFNNLILDNTYWIICDLNFFHYLRFKIS
jgi:hypothetical protein